jgi:hypothetical protein
MTALDWWEPLGEPGRIEVRELLSPAVWQRYFAADPEVELELGRTEIGGEVLDLRARRLSRFIRSDAEVVAELDLSGPVDVTGGWEKPVLVLGTQGRAVLQTDEGRSSRLRGALRYLSISTDATQWAWHFEGGRAAGERLVLLRGSAPGEGPSLVTTHPSAQGRSLGNPKGGASADARVVTWTPDACAVDVLVAELCAMSRLHGLVDYRGARIAEGVSELLDVLPRADANVE